MNKQIENLQNLAFIQNQLFCIYEQKASKFTYQKSYEFCINSLISIHKSYEHSNCLIRTNRKNLKEITVQKMLSEIAWKKYFQYLQLNSYFSQEAIRINCSLQNPQLFAVAGNTILPLLKNKGHITEKYKIGNCLEIAKKQQKRPPSSGPNGRLQKYEIQAVGYTKKEIMEMHMEFLKQNNLCATIESTKIQKINFNQLLSRTRIEYLKSNNFSQYNGLIYYCKNEKFNLDSHFKKMPISSKIQNSKYLQIKKIKSISEPLPGYEITLKNGEIFNLFECSIKELLNVEKIMDKILNSADYINTKIYDFCKNSPKEDMIKNLFVLDIMGPYIWYDLPSDEKIQIYKRPMIRKLNLNEISELAFSYFSLRMPVKTLSVEKLFSNIDSVNLMLNLPTNTEELEKFGDSKTIFAWVKENIGSTSVKQYLIRLIPESNYAENLNSKQNLKSTYCRWPLCLQNSCVFTGQKSITQNLNSGLSNIFMGFTRIFTDPDDYMDIIFREFSVFKNARFSGKELEPNNKFYCEHYCIFHRQIAIISAFLHKISLFSMYFIWKCNKNREKCKEFEDILRKKERKSAINAGLIQKIENGNLRETFSKLCKIAAKRILKRGDKITNPCSILKNVWIEKFKIEHIPFNHLM